MTGDMEFRVRRLSAFLVSFRYLFNSEVSLHEALSDVLARAGEPAEREKILDARNRADLFLAGGLLIEVKVDGSLSAALRQCERYSGLPQVEGVILASTAAWARRQLVTRPKMAGKPFGMVHLQRQSL
jgi:hypothetical protein